MRSGRRGAFAAMEASGENRGRLASQKALEQLQREGINAETCCGAVACIYGSSTMSFGDYHQALTVLDSTFPQDTNIVFGCLIDENIGEAVRVTILAMK